MIAAASAGAGGVVVLFLRILLGVAVLALGWFLVRLYFNWQGKLMERITYTRSFSEEGVFAGDEVLFCEEIFNPTWFPIFKVRVQTYVYGALAVDGFAPCPGEMQLLESRFVLWPRMRIRRTHRVLCVARGSYALESVTLLRTQWPLLLEAPAQLRVYPSPHMSLPPSAATAVRQGEYRSRLHLYADRFSFVGIRDYLPGDPLSLLNHKATARSMTGGAPPVLKVNCHEYAAGRTVILLMDYHLPPGSMIDYDSYARMAEAGLSCIASLLVAVIRDGGRFGLYDNCRTPSGESFRLLPPEGGQAHLTRTLRLLAETVPQDGGSFRTLLAQAFPGGGSDAEIYLLTFCPDPNREDALRACRFPAMVRLDLSHMVEEAES